jgi:hypothetical protein
MTTNLPVLGTKLYVTGYALGGKPTAKQLALILQQTVSFIGMDTAGLPPKIWAYPLNNGQGGLGETICQPLVESFMVADSWPDLDKVYVVLASCRPYSVDAVGSYLDKAIGPILRQGSFEL